MDFKTFLSDRIAEDEQLAQAVIDGHAADHRWVHNAARPDDCAHITHWSPWRVLSGCVAKRLILIAHRQQAVTGPGNEVIGYECSVCRMKPGQKVEWPCFTLRTMALEYSDHELYRYEWRPQRLSAGRSTSGSHA